MNDEKWRREVARDAGRLAAARRARRTLLAQTPIHGTQSELFLVPVVGGAYLGRWLDELAAGYSTRWTVSLIVLGIALGAFNVVHFIRRYW